MKISLMEPKMTEEMISEAKRALKEEFFLRGKSVGEFERAFSDYIGTKEAIAVDSGTSALHFSLLGLGIGKDDGVVTTPATFISTANAVLYTGAEPIFADISMETYNISVAKIREILEEDDGKIKALLPVHLYGFPAKMGEIKRLAHQHDLTVIEDACQAHGTQYKGRKIGSWGDVAAFSFYPSKNMTVGGDGGMITTDDKKLADEVRKIRDVGRSLNDSNVHERIGFTGRMNTVNAAVGRVQLKYLDQWNRDRKRKADHYRSKLSNVGDIYLPPSEGKDIKSSWYLFVIRTSYRDELRSYLAERGVQTGIHYKIPVHLQPPYREKKFEEGMYPNSEKWAREVLSLPMYPDLKDDEIDYVCEHIKQFFKERM